ncbi:ABC transporter ATP-binding protein [Candidatus Methanomassiliicoccus intestinalis]|jgi:ABC transporter related protein|uniref:ABC transporter domain-containing protein n=1 Tax=Candidatus Methanomassiliicoccus intestinalis TaxID=1406512 RepID=A0A8J8PGT1_9ARCH|nr:MAG: hypothetical protein A3207_06080 [Candidatus Methanomassiliicoccus intestinalis]
MSEVAYIKNLTAEYKGFKAIDNITFKVEEGEFVGIVGPNGSGKTTTLKILSGLMLPSNGTVTLNGIDVTQNPSDALNCVGCVIGTPELYHNATPSDILNYVGRIFNIQKSKLDSKVDEVLEKVSMTEWKDKKTRTFSKGMKQRIVIAQALMNDPKMLILDEPTSGLDPIGMNDISLLLKDLNSAGTAILLSSHVLHSVSMLCDRVLILDHGKIVKEGAPSRLLSKNGIKNLLVRTVDIPSEDDLLKVKALPNVTSALKTSDGIQISLNGSITDQQLLLAALINMDIPVYGMESLDSLEDVFIEATRGD